MNSTRRSITNGLKDAVKNIADAAHVPAVGYAYAAPKDESKQEYTCTTLAYGKKNAQSSGTDKNVVDDSTQFPASSLSKIVFTYLVLQLVKEEKIDLDEPLHNILQNERFKQEGKYPEKAKALTARHVLSHTTGLPNLGEDMSSPLSFDSNSELGEKYSYSGEAFFYLQQVIEKIMGKNLEALAKEYVFDPLKMERSTFFPQPEIDTNIVKVHTELEKPTTIYIGDPPINAAGSLLTTSEDFSKFMSAWLEKMDDPIFKQAFEPANVDGFKQCGLGWHIYKNKDDAIAYQYGENLNTRSLVAINVSDRKGAAFFTNSENGMSIANQLLCSPELNPIGNMQEVFKYMHYVQSDEPGWRETLAGRIAEDQGKLGEAKEHLEQALRLAPEDESKKLRLQWFNEAHQPAQEKTYKPSLNALEGKYKNPYNDEIDLYVKDSGLVYRQFGQETKLVRISKTEFLPETDQSFKISINGGQLNIHSVHGYEKSLTKQPLSKPKNSSTADIARKLCVSPDKFKPQEPKQMSEKQVPPNHGNQGEQSRQQANSHQADQDSGKKKTMESFSTEPRFSGGKK